MATRATRPAELFVGYAQTPAGGDRWENAPVGTYEYRFPIPPIGQELVVKQHVLKESHFQGTTLNDEPIMRTEFFVGDQLVGEIEDSPSDEFLFILRKHSSMLYVVSEVGGADDGPAYQYLQIAWVNARKGPFKEGVHDLVQRLYGETLDQSENADQGKVLVMHLLPGSNHQYGIPSRFHHHVI